MFEKLALEYVDVGPVRLRVCHGGSGYPVLLLHGHPRTHTTWHRVAPLLARDFSVVCPDLRGHGRCRRNRPSLTITAAATASAPWPGTA